MYNIKVKTDFSAAHNLRNYRGSCEHLHGHNWVVEAVFRYKSLAKDGMAVDFKEAKSILKAVLAQFDHAYLNETGSFKSANPTSENIAKFIYDELKKKDNHIQSVSVWENDSSCATYRA